MGGVWSGLTGGNIGKEAAKAIERGMRDMGVDAAREVRGMVNDILRAVERCGRPMLRVLSQTRSFCGFCSFIVVITAMMLCFSPVMMRSPNNASKIVTTSTQCKTFTTMGMNAYTRFEKGNGAAIWPTSKELRKFRNFSPGKQHCYYRGLSIAGADYQALEPFETLLGGQAEPKPFSFSVMLFQLTALFAVGLLCVGGGFVAFTAPRACRRVLEYIGHFIVNIRRYPALLLAVLFYTSRVVIFFNVLLNFATSDDDAWIKAIARVVFWLLIFHYPVVFYMQSPRVDFGNKIFVGALLVGLVAIESFTHSLAPILESSMEKLPTVQISVM